MSKGDREENAMGHLMLTGIFIALAFLAVTPTASAQALPEGVERTLVLAPSENNPRNSEGDFVQLSDGRILFVYTHFTGSSSDFGAAHLAGRYSTDGGRTWSEEDVVLVPNEGGMNVMSVSLLRLQSGDIALFYLRKNSRGDCRPFMRISKDEAETWSEPALCIEPLGYFVVNNDRVLQLESGRLVIPAARHSLPGEEFRRRGEALCYLSDDNGATWFRSDTVLQAPEASKSGLQEPLVVALKDGRLMMLCRTDQGCQMRSYSADAAVTWSPIEMTDILSPVSPASVERIPNTGDLVMVWNSHRGIDPALRGKRTPLTTAVSKDEGATWENAKNLEDNPTGWYCYTAIEFVGDAVLIGSCAGDTATVGGLNRSQVIAMHVDWLYR
jgi:Neuraminidase (sialidase)